MAENYDDDKMENVDCYFILLFFFFYSILFLFVRLSIFSSDSAFWEDMLAIFLMGSHNMKMKEWKSNIKTRQKKKMSERKE